MKKTSLLFMSAMMAATFQEARALEIDEKLTLRFLNVSSTQRTVLTNRGAEDGLVVGDHAKFFITAGVVARGVVEKVSPTRSVWSLYRVVDSNEIIKDKVLNIKISTPAKITEDPSKSLKELGIPGAGTDAVMLSKGDDLSLTDSDVNELEEITPTTDTASQKTPPKTRSKANVDPNVKKVNDIPIYRGAGTSNKTWEAFGTIYINSLTGSAESDLESSTSTSDSVTSSSFALALGIEKYFFNTDNFLKNMSVIGFLNRKSIEAGENVKTSTDYLEFGGGINYHFYNAPNSLNQLIGYGSLTAGLGKTSQTSKVVTSGTSNEEVADGSSNFFSLGVGAKYILSSDFGFRATLDYFVSNESYEFDTETVTKSLSGPRVQLGLSYRF